MTIRASFPWAVVAVGALFACAVLSPHILQRLDAEFPFQGIEIMATDAEPHYAARVREVADGFPQLGNVFYSSPKEQPYLQPPLPEWTLAQLASVLPIDVVFVFVLSKALFAFLLVVLFTSFFVSVTGKQWESLLAVVMLLFAGSALGAPWNLLSFVLDPSFSYGFLRFARPVNPQWTAAWFFLTLWLTASWLRQRETWKLLLAGAFMAVLLYSYLYAWTYLGATFFLLFLFFLWKRDLPRCRDLLLLAGVFIVLGIPYALNIIESLQHPWYADTVVRHGLILRRTPIVGIWIMLFLILSVFSHRLWPATWPLVPALSVGGLLALNQHVATGMYLVPHHYHWYFIQPLASVFILLALFSLLRSSLTLFVHWGRMIVCVAFLTAIAFGFAQQLRAYRSERRAWGERQAFAPVLWELRKRTRPGIVVYATGTSALRELIPVYTSADIYALAGNTNHYLTPMTRAREAFFFDLWLSGLKPKEAETRFFRDLRWSAGSRIYSIYYRELLGDYAAIPDQVVAEHLEAYRKYFALSFEEKLHLYPLHLIVFTPWDTPLTQEMQALQDAGDVIYERDGYAVVTFPWD